MLSKKRLNVALMMAVTVIVAACSSGGSSAAPSAAAPSAAAPSAEASAAPVDRARRRPRRLRRPSGARPPIPGDADLVIWADDKRAAALKPLADQYGQDNGVKVVVQAISTEHHPDVPDRQPGRHGAGHRRLGA